MDKFLKPFAFFLAFVMVEVEAIRGSYKPQDASSVKLFVFGDSYVDTGNTPKLFSPSWKQPYGMTFPGKPSGRFSDGRVLTDYIAKFFNVKSPIPYEQRKSKAKLLQEGMNFAYGGTGVFNTIVPLPNMTIQIDYFQQLLEKKVYTKNDLASSIALISPAGNDYCCLSEKKWKHKGVCLIYFYIKNEIGLPSFALRVINQIALNLKRVHDLGVKKIAVVAIEPLGCLPRFTCPIIFALQRAVQNLRSENKGSTFVILDLYCAFVSALDRTELLKCERKRSKMYTVCQDPNSSFFWDSIHPSQQGWGSVYSILQSSLQQLSQNVPSLAS
ncbi:GDSL esterase/lipase At5g03610-like [Actinidia eriantha]|uniref:GDSL esterase/lipase At5g03610-like n=1 Tax=Actinidia eriantha TaxID=165200 RepID=UPI002584DAC4|nr:GDSL esterase/lipase At5g03610-like [Actinidia eriantha]